MTASLQRRLMVATRIACGARSRAGNCEDGCADVPLDLVEAACVDALAARLAAIGARVAALREVAEQLAGGVPPDRAQARRQAARGAASAGAGGPRCAPVETTEVIAYLVRLGTRHRSAIYVRCVSRPARGRDQRNAQP